MVSRKLRARLADGLRTQGARCRKELRTAALPRFHRRLRAGRRHLRGPHAGPRRLGRHVDRGARRHCSPAKPTSPKTASSSRPTSRNPARATTTEIRRRLLARRNTHDRASRRGFPSIADGSSCWLSCVWLRSASTTFSACRSTPFPTSPTSRCRSTPRRRAIRRSKPSNGSRFRSKPRSRACPVLPTRARSRATACRR